MRSAITTSGTSRHPERRTKSRALVALALVIGTALLLPAPAHAGTYRAALCNPDLAAFHADADFERTSRRFGSTASCGVGGDGLAVSRDAGPIGGGAWGAWVIRSPRGTTISKLSVKAAGRGGRGNVAELLIGPATEPRILASPTSVLRRFRWSGEPARTFMARLRCRRRAGCPRGRASRVRVKRLALILHDRVGPRLRLGGSLFAPGARRGRLMARPRAADVGGGVRRILLQVNGQPVSARVLRCRLADRIALRLGPCPARAEGRFAAATASPPFRQGPNRVRVCAIDFAATTAAHRACADRRVRVDNLCPIAGIGGAITLRTRLHRRGARAVVSGRLLGKDGEGVSGARVCVGTRVPLAGVPERILLAPLTDAGGRFKVAVPAGPSRRVRVAYWPSAMAALERFLHLDVPARPHLRLRPHRRIENGDRIRFRVRLPGPRSSGRRVRIQAHAGHRWLDVRSGLADARGLYRASYRFHATTKKRRYSFRAVVPKQRGYPYEAGTSKVRRATVVG